MRWLGSVVQAQEMITVSLKVEGSNLEYSISVVPTKDGVQSIAQKFCRERKEDFGITDDNLIACLVPVVDYLSQFVPKEPEKAPPREEDVTVTVHMKIGGFVYNIKWDNRRTNINRVATKFCIEQGEYIKATFDDCLGPVEAHLMQQVLLQQKKQPVAVVEDVSLVKVKDNGPLSQSDDPICDVVLILTVWKRDTLNQMLQMISRQTVVKTHKLCVTVFQNGQHISVLHILLKWEAILDRTRAFSLYYINSLVETGYYGRFIVPLAARGTLTARYWGVFDDDIIFGSRYLENAFRVNDEGYFCTRNGRLVEADATETIVNERGFDTSLQVTADQDADFDFGGHIWVGRMLWIRSIWRHPPPTVSTSEDFWLSAVLKSHYGIGTRTARCPSKASGLGDIELCACSMVHAAEHVSAIIGDNISGLHSLERNVTEMTGKRRIAMQHILQTYGRDFLLPLDQRERTKSKFAYTKRMSSEAFDVSGSIFEACLFWI